MEQSETSERLPSDFVHRLLAVPEVGDRVRLIRRYRGFNSQTAFLAALAESSGGKAPSKAWLSGIESGDLPLTAERARQMSRVLELAESEQGLLTPEAAEVPASEAMKRYAAWQAVRLKLADEMLRGRSGEERRRGRAVYNRLHDVLEEDDEIRRAANNRIARVDQFTDTLPEAARWLLLVEASFLDPFHPYSPFEYEWSTSRTEILDAIAMDLGLADARSAIKDCIEAVRRPGGVKRLRDEKSFDRDPPGLSRAAWSVADPGGDLALLRGGALVGALGWDFVAGVFLVARPLEDRTTDLGVAQAVWRGFSRSPVPTRAIVAPGSAFLAVSMAAVMLTAARAALAAQRDAKTAQGSVVNEADLEAVSFLASLGDKAVYHELAKLKAVTQLRDRLKGREDGFAQEGLPRGDDVTVRLDGLRDSIAAAIRARRVFDRTDADAVKPLTQIRKHLANY